MRYFAPEVLSSLRLEDGRTVLIVVKPIPQIPVPAVAAALAFELSRGTLHGNERVTRLRIAVASHDPRAGRVEHRQVA